VTQNTGEEQPEEKQTKRYWNKIAWLSSHSIVPAVKHARRSMASPAKALMNHNHRDYRSKVNFPDREKSDRDNTWSVGNISCNRSQLHFLEPK
jgi:hypothetical protein